MRANLSSRVLRGMIAAAIVAAPAVAHAQLPNASPAATALGGAYTALARGYDAVAWNPANLGLRDNTSFSLGLLSVSGSSGLDPISLNDVAPYSGKTLPSTVIDQWYSRIVASQGETGRINAGITELGLSLGNFALQVGTSIGGSTNLSPGVAEAILYGNAGRRPGQIDTLSLAGSSFRVGAYTTAGLSYGMSVQNDRTRQVTVGATVKYTVGNFLGIARDNGSLIGADSVKLNFPMVYTNPDSSNGIAGKGYGLDLGMSWKEGKLTFGATAQNVMNTFAWDATKFLTRVDTASFTGASSNNNNNNNSSGSGFSKDQPYSTAPQALRDAVANDKFKPAFAAGVAYDMYRDLTLAGSFRQQATGGISTDPAMQIGGGAEYRGIPLLALRAGAQIITSGWGVSGGVGIELWHYELSAGAELLTRNGGKQPGITFNVVSVH